MEKETIVNIEFTPNEEKIIRSYAAAHNMSISDYVVQIIKEKIATLEKTVEVEVWLPAWLDKKATEQNIDLSAVLQDALKQIVG